MLEGMAAPLALVNDGVNPLTGNFENTEGSNKASLAIMGMTSLMPQRAASPWMLKPWERGRVIENMLGANTGWNFPVIDRYLNGVATSIKTIDLDAKTYQTGSNLTSVLNKHINDLAKFAGADWAKVTVPGNAAKELQLAIPHGGSQAQQAAIQAAAQRAQAQGIKLTTTIIP